MTCLRALNPASYVCNTCQVNSISSCRPDVDLDLTRYDNMIIGTEMPCWLYDSSSLVEESKPNRDFDDILSNHMASYSTAEGEGGKTYRVFLNNPKVLLGYPTTPKWWLTSIGVASLLLFMTLYSLCKGQFFSVRYCRGFCRNPQKQHSTQHSGVFVEDYDNGSRCCFFLRTKTSYTRFSDSTSQAPNGHR